MNLFKKIELTFDRYDNTIRKYLSKTFNNLGLEYTHTQIFGVIFDGIKGVMQNMLFYIEDALTEQNVFKASRKQSVYSLAKISGYEPHYGSASAGTLLAKIIQNNGLSETSSKIYIYNHSRIVNTLTGVVYSINLPTNYYVIDIYKPLVIHEFKIVQGVYTTNTYIASGNILETIHIYTVAQFDREYIEVKVNGEIWNEVGNIYDMTEDGHEYIINIGYENAFDITFGTGIYGHKLIEGDTVTIEYLEHSGEFGDISPDSNYKFIFEDKGYNALGDAVDLNNYVTFDLQNCISGGTPPDSIEFIKSMIGSNSRSMVLVSEENFKLFFKRFSFIGTLNCWVDTNSMYVNITCLSNFKKKIHINEDYFNIDIKDMILNDEQKSMIINTLNNSNKSFAGITVKFIDPIIRRYAFICYVKVDNVYDREVVKAQIRNLLGEYFINLEEGIEMIAKSDIIKTLTTKIENIKALDIDIISEYGENAYYNSTYTKYTLKYVNNSYTYVEENMIYENDVYPGLDIYGNIILNSKMEIPVLHGGFNYYPDKSSKNKIMPTSIKIPDIQIYFI